MWAREQLVIDGGLIGQDGLAVALGGAFQLAMGTNHLPPGITIGGVLVDMVCSREAAGTDALTSQLQYGLVVGVADDEAEVPRPLTDPHADWMWQQQIVFPAVGAGTLSESTWGSQAGPIRIRSKRKCEEVNQDLFIVFQGTDIAPTYNVNAFISTLLLLP